MAREARRSADQGSESVTHLDQAMRKIQQSSDEIAKIIKTIDDIAFQTNILALNAAVEAARAGESGLGFAVVADEVRRLAQRSAAAARDTSTLIQGALNSTVEGAQISQAVNRQLGEIITKARSADELINEVAKAMAEETTGIQHVNTAVANMDTLTQSTATEAEEAAAAAAELREQAENTRRAAADLAEMVGK
jgi:methyl-accepting chemotaxis protein